MKFLRELGVQVPNTTKIDICLALHCSFQSPPALQYSIAWPSAFSLGVPAPFAGIEDDQNNFTRFILLRADPVSLPPGVACKTSIVFSLDNIAGATRWSWCWW